MDMKVQIQNTRLWQQHTHHILLAICGEEHNRKEEKKMQGRGERRRQNRILAMKETSKNLNRVRVRLAAWGWPGSENILLKSRKELALAMEQDGWQNLVNRQDLLPQS